MGSGAGDQLRWGWRLRPLLSLLTAVQAEVARLDPGQLPARDAMDVVKVLDRVGRVADAGKMAAALRVAESSLWKRSGRTSAADWLAATTGVGVGDAVRALKTAEVVADAPETRDALARGEVSPRQAAAVAEVEKLSPEKGRQLLADAKKKSAKELETEAAQIVAAASSGDRRRESRTSSPGSPVGGGYRSRRDGVGVLETPARRARPARGAARRGQGARSSPTTVAATRRTPAAYLADALVALGDRAEHTRGSESGNTGAEATTDRETTARAGAGDAGGVPEGGDWSFAKVIVRVDATALARGELAPEGTRARSPDRDPSPSPTRGRSSTAVPSWPP